MQLYIYSMMTCNLPNQLKIFVHLFWHKCTK